MKTTCEHSGYSWDEKDPGELRTALAESKAECERLKTKMEDLGNEYSIVCHFKNELLESQVRESAMRLALEKIVQADSGDGVDEFARVIRSARDAISPNAGNKILDALAAAKLVLNFCDETLDNNEFPRTLMEIKEALKLLDAVLGSEAGK